MGLLRHNETPALQEYFKLVIKNERLIKNKA